VENYRTGQNTGHITPMYYANQTIRPIIGAEGNGGLIFALLAYGVIVMALAVLTLREQE
jgi:hypothetical protein